MKVLARKHLPARLESGGMIAGWLLMDRLGAPSWAFVLFWVLSAISAIHFVWMVFAQEESTPRWNEVDSILDRIRAMLRK